MMNRRAASGIADDFVGSFQFRGDAQSPVRRESHAGIYERPAVRVHRPTRQICTLGSAWGDEFKKPRSFGEGTGAKASDNSEAPQRATASRLVSTILRI
jgi:hypothetical protein